MRRCLPTHCRQTSQVRTSALQSFASQVSDPRPPIPTRWRFPRLIAPARVAICVLPFTNLSGDPEQEYFSDGITEDIITELSRWRLLAVRSRSASFRYRGIAVD